MRMRRRFGKGDSMTSTCGEKKLNQKLEYMHRNPVEASETSDGLAVEQLEFL